MIRKHRWAWVLLFISGVILLGVLATGWNIVLVQDYHRLLELAKSASREGDLPSHPFAGVIFGTLGFIAVITGLSLFFSRLLKEMRLNQMQSEFLAAISHELKTPIATMELSASLLRTGGLSEEESMRLWSSHDGELKRLKQEVEALLEAARFQATPMRIQKSPLHLETWVNQSMRRWRELLGPRSFLERQGDTLNCEAKMDLRMLNLITDNLVDNARKFSKGTPRVIIQTQRLPAERPLQPPRWQIRILDEGWGFNPEDSERIFKRFFRSKTEAPYAIPGTGLGLYLAASASRALGVSLRGHSNGIGRGASFTLEGKEIPPT